MGRPYLRRALGEWRGSFLTTEEISDHPLAEVFSEGIVWTVLAQTGFGHAWLALIYPGWPACREHFCGRNPPRCSGTSTDGAVLQLRPLWWDCWLGPAMRSGLPAPRVWILHLTAMMYCISSLRGGLGGALVLAGATAGRATCSTRMTPRCRIRANRRATVLDAGRCQCSHHPGHRHRQYLVSSRARCRPLRVRTTVTFCC